MPKIDEKKLESYRKVFEECDGNRDSVVCLKELKAFLSLRRHANDLPEDKVRYIFKLADKDGDKRLNFDEFVHILEHPDLQFTMGQWMNNYVNFLVPRPKPVKQIVRRGRSVRISQVGKSKTPGDAGIELSESAELRTLFAEEQERTYADEYSCCPPPLIMVLISILELAFFATDEIIQKNSTLSGTGKMAQMFLFAPNKRYQAWRFLTYMFVHIGYFHLAINLAVQLLLGIPLEMVHKWWRVLIVYFSGVIAGSLATSIADPWVRLAGASGGVYALMTAHISTIIMNWSEISNPIVHLFLFGVIVVSDLGTSIYDRYYLNINDQIGYAAHLGGAVAGLLVGIYILRNLNVKKCENYIWWGALVTYVILMGTAILLNIFLPGRYPS